MVVVVVLVVVVVAIDVVGVVVGDVGVVVVVGDVGAVVATDDVVVIVVVVVVVALAGKLHWLVGVGCRFLSSTCGAAGPRLPRCCVRAILRAHFTNGDSLDSRLQEQRGPRHLRR